MFENWGISPGAYSLIFPSFRISHEWFDFSVYTRTFRGVWLQRKIKSLVGYFIVCLEKTLPNLFIPCLLHTHTAKNKSEQLTCKMIQLVIEVFNVTVYGLNSFAFFSDYLPTKPSINNLSRLCSGCRSLKNFCFRKFVLSERDKDLSKRTWQRSF